jgi:MFS family permease
VARDSRRLDVALAGGLGTASGQAYLDSCRDLAHWSPLEILAFLLGTVIVAWLAWRFVEPFFGALFLTGHLVAADRHPPRSLNVRRYLRVFVVVLTTAVFAETLVHSLTHELGRVVEWISAIATYGLVTYAWAVGAARQPPRAARWGALAGALVGLAVSGVVAVIAFRLGVDGVFPPGRPPSIASVVCSAVGGAIAMSIRGFAGGKAIDLRSRLPAGLRVLAGVGVVTLLQGVVAAVLGSPAWSSRVVEAIGWGAGLLFHPAADAVLGSSSGERQASPSRPAAPEPPPASPGRPGPSRDAASQPGVSGTEAARLALERRGHISVALAGGIGAASGISYWAFIEHVRDWPAIRIAVFFLITAIVAWLAWRFFEPFFASVLLRRRLPGAPEPGPRVPRRLGMAFLAVLTSAVTLEVLFHALMIQHGQGLLQWLGAVVMFTVVTYAWARAARRQPTRAGRAGAVAGALVGAGTLGAVGAFVGGGAVFQEAQALGASTQASLADAINLALTGLVTMAPRGYGGGKAIDLGGRLPVGVRVMLGVSMVVAAQIGVDVLGMAALGVRIRSPWEVWALEAIGWGVGVLLCPYSESVFRASRPEHPAQPG